MENQILSSINSVFQTQENQNSSGIGNFDLNDDRFANILDEKIGEFNNDIISDNTQDITKQLGVPAGLDIEGFDYYSLIEDINPQDMVEAINTESNLRDDSRFDTVAMVKDAAEAFSPVVESLSNSQFSFDSPNSSNPIKAVKNFWTNQASNFYSLMGKDTINDLNELIAKL